MPPRGRIGGNAGDQDDGGLDAVTPRLDEETPHTAAGIPQDLALGGGMHVEQGDQAGARIRQQVGPRQHQVLPDRWQQYEDEQPQLQADKNQDKTAHGVPRLP